MKIEKIADASGTKVSDPIEVVHYPEELQTDTESRCPYLEVKCGWTGNSFDIYLDPVPCGNIHEDTLVISGVTGTIDQWRKIILPLLGVDLPVIPQGCATYKPFPTPR